MQDYEAIPHIKVASSTCSHRQTWLGNWCKLLIYLCSHTSFSHIGSYCGKIWCCQLSRIIHIVKSIIPDTIELGLYIKLFLENFEQYVFASRFLHFISFFFRFFFKTCMCNYLCRELQKKSLVVTFSVLSRYCEFRW